MPPGAAVTACCSRGPGRVVGARRRPWSPSITSGDATRRESRSKCVLPLVGRSFRDRRGSPRSARRGSSCGPGDRLCMGADARQPRTHPRRAIGGRSRWSRKRLLSRFRSQIGLNPKRALQLIRFDVAAHRLAAGHSPAAAAAAGGYVDQSHLTETCWRSPGRPPHPLRTLLFSRWTRSHGSARSTLRWSTPRRTSS